MSAAYLWGFATESREAAWGPGVEASVSPSVVV